MSTHHYILFSEITDEVIGWWITDNETEAIKNAKECMNAAGLTYQTATLIKGNNLSLE